MSPNSRRSDFIDGRRSEKWPKNRTKIQSFDQGFFGSKKSGLNTKALSFFDQFQDNFKPIVTIQFQLMSAKNMIF